MNFGEALAALKEGKKVSRSIWRGYWFLMQPAVVNGTSVAGEIIEAKFEKIIVAVLKNGQGSAPAMPYQEDILAEDWQIVD